MLRRTLVLAALSAFGCSSASFQVNAGDTGTDPSDTSTTSEETDTSSVEDSDSPKVDAPPPGPCDEEPGKAKFCVKLQASGDRPTLASAPAEMNIDGKGKAYLALYDKDPLLPGAKLVQFVEAIGGELDIAKDLPASVIGEGAPAVYSALAFFADSTNPRVGSQSLLPGDYVTLPSVAGLAYSYKKITLTAGKVYKDVFEMSAVRRLTLTVNADLAVKAEGTSVHGTGPVFLGLTDASAINDATTFLHLDTRGCVNLNIQGVFTSGRADFPVTVTGKRNLFAGVIDYDPLKPKFPGQGTLISAQTGTLPTVTIDPLAWTAAASAKLVAVAYGAMDAGSTDPTPKCE